MTSTIIDVDNTLTIWGVVCGPMHSSEIEGWEDEEDSWVVVCQLENSYGGLDVEEINFYTFDEAYEVVDYFKHGKAPYYLEPTSNA